LKIRAGYPPILEKAGVYQGMRRVGCGRQVQTRTDDWNNRDRYIAMFQRDMVPKRVSLDPSRNKGLIAESMCFGLHRRIAVVKGG
jgi:hypothetical protein